MAGVAPTLPVGTRVRVIRLGHDRAHLASHLNQIGTIIEDLPASCMYRCLPGYARVRLDGRPRYASDPCFRPDELAILHTEAIP